MILLPIIYENNEIRIINKPSGLAVQGGAGVSVSVDTVLAKQTKSKVYLVHRLDKDTAGLLITAKNPAAASKWTNLIASKAVTKEYYAVCAGSFFKRSGTIDSAVEYKKKQKSALTYFTVEKSADVCLSGAFSALESFSSPKAFGAPAAGTASGGVFTDGSAVRLSLVRLTLGTGRMHQLRIHLAAQGAPIAGDDKYGDFKLNRVLRSAFGIKKLHLAAVCLRFSEAAAKVPPRIDIPLPDHIVHTLSLF